MNYTTINYYDQGMASIATAILLAAMVIKYENPNVVLCSIGMFFLHLFLLGIYQKTKEVRIISQTDTDEE